MVTCRYDLCLSYMASMINDHSQYDHRLSCQVSGQSLVLRNCSQTEAVPGQDRVTLVLRQAETGV